VFSKEYLQTGIWHRIGSYIEKSVQAVQAYKETKKVAGRRFGFFQD